MDQGMHGKGDWPYAVMQDLITYLRDNDLKQTAELLDDAALTFVEERRRADQPTASALRLIHGSKG